MCVLTLKKYSVTRKWNRLTLFVATVSTDSAVFVATLSTDSAVFNKTAK